MKTSTALMTGAIVFAAVLSGCERVPRMAVESSDLGRFDAVDFHGAAELNIVVGQPSEFSVSGGERAVKQLETSVRGNTLYLRAQKSGWSWFGDQRKLVLNIHTPSLISFVSNGAGDVHISGLAGGEHTVRIAGAHNVEAEGTLDSLTIELDGAGNIDYGKVKTREVNVRVNGAGNVEVDPTVSLDAQVNGVGAVQYRDEPQRVTSSIHGLGTIQRK